MSSMRRLRFKSGIGLAAAALFALCSPAWSGFDARPRAATLVGSVRIFVPGNAGLHFTADLTLSVPTTAGVQAMPTFADAFDRARVTIHEIDGHSALRLVREQWDIECEVFLHLDHRASAYFVEWPRDASPADLVLRERGLVNRLEGLVLALAEQTLRY